MAVTNVMVSDKAEVTSAILATGSCVQGDWLMAYSTATDDMFAEARNDAYTAGSFAVARLTGGSEGLAVGIALNNASSGDTLAVAHEGLFIGVSQGGVTAGYTTMLCGQGLQDNQFDASGAGFEVGRAFTGASAGAKYVLFKLNI